MTGVDSSQPALAEETREFFAPNILAFSSAPAATGADWALDGADPIFEEDNRMKGIMTWRPISGPPTPATSRAHLLAKAWAVLAIGEIRRGQVPGRSGRANLWGYVNEADPYVMEMEIQAAVDHGVNVFIYDWYW